MKYVRRNLIDKITAGIKHEQAVVLTGARQTGKTTLCEMQLPAHLNLPFSYISFDDPDERLRFQRSAVAILDSIDTPLVILDEVQKIPSLFEPLKLVVDRQKKQESAAKKVFILTGSSQLMLMKSIRETLAGRVSLHSLYPFSLAETAGAAELSVLSRIWQAQSVPGNIGTTFQTLPADKARALQQKRDEHQAWGGYPPVLLKKEPADRLNWLRDYRTTYLERDISDVGQVSDIDTFALAQKILCARSGNILSISAAAREIGLAGNTIKRYVNLLAMTFQCFLLQPYHENIGKRLIKSPKIFFPDAGLNKAILGDISIDRGAAYESWVFAELIKWKQLQPVEPDLFFYRTGAGLEIDFLLAEQGKLLPVEAKAGRRVTSADGRSIQAFMNGHPCVCKSGIVVYPGNEFAEIMKNIWAVPDWFLFGLSL